MQKDAGQQIWPASSIYRKYSNATATKSCSNVSGGAYWDIREVTTEWNARPKHRFLPEFRCRLHPASPSALFFHIFSRAWEKIWPPEAPGSRKFASEYRSYIKRPVQPDKAAPEFFYCGSCGGVGSCAAFFALRFLPSLSVITISFSYLSLVLSPLLSVLLVRFSA